MTDFEFVLKFIRSVHLLCACLQHKFKINLHTDLTWKPCATLICIVLFEDVGCKGHIAVFTFTFLTHHCFYFVHSAPF
jgi:hypothetical protein